ncbi:MAG: YihY/virulence factor BrkB family protein [Gemmatimonadaceae bacterium]
MARARPWHPRVWAGLKDYGRRVWDNSGEDDIFFLASGISFNILLAIVPFLLLFATSLTYLLNQSTEVATDRIIDLMNQFLPPNPDGSAGGATSLISDVIKSRGAVGLYSAITFVWFSTRLFGSLRSVLAEIFDIEIDRGIVDGKVFDVKITLVSSLIFVVYTALSAYLALASTRGVAIFAALGIRQDVMGSLEYTLGRVVAFLFISALFFGLYKFLPYKKIRWQTALVACGFTGVMFEIAKSLFTIYVRSFQPGSLYTGTVAALVITILWVYYAAVVFILGGEVAQVYELRHMRRRQHEAFEE